MKIVTHPVNAAMLRKRFEVEQPRMPMGTFSWLNSVEIVESQLMERDKPTGRYILPDGQVVDRDSVLVRRRFVDYGPEDIPLLLYVGLIREEREPLFYQMDDSLWRFRSFMDFPVVMQPRAMLMSTV
jgi:hypothetical protein